jgi:hypothetical protein
MIAVPIAILLFLLIEHCKSRKTTPQIPIENIKKEVQNSIDIKELTKSITAQIDTKAITNKVMREIDTKAIAKTITGEASGLENVYDILMGIDAQFEQLKKDIESLKKSNLVILDEVGSYEKSLQNLTQIAKTAYIMADYSGHTKMGTTRMAKFLDTNTEQIRQAIEELRKNGFIEK